MKKVALFFVMILSLGLSAQSEVTTYFANGNTKMKLLKIGDRSLQVSYFESGEIKHTGGYHKDAPSGPWRSFNINGEVVAEGKYTNGKKLGIWFIYAPETKRNYKLYYEEGTRIDAFALK